MESCYVNIINFYPPLLSWHLDCFYDAENCKTILADVKAIEIVNHVQNNFRDLTNSKNTIIIF